MSELTFISLFKGRYANIAPLWWPKNYQLFTHEPTARSWMNKGFGNGGDPNVIVKQNSEVSNGLHDLVTDGNISVIKIADGDIATEMQLTDGRILVTEYNVNGHLRVTAFEKNPVTEQYEPKPAGSIQKIDKQSVLMAILLGQLDAGFPDVTSGDGKTQLSELQAAIQNKDIDMSKYYLASDILYHAVTNGIFAIEEKSVANSNFAPIEETRISSGILKGVLLYGKAPTVLAAEGEEKVIVKNIGWLMSLPVIKEFRDENMKRLSPKEMSMIPDPDTDKDVADEVQYLPEVEQIALHIVLSTKTAKPIRNIAWKGLTGYGKSTACRQIARILGYPYVVMSCNNETTTEDFLTKFVPVTTGEGDTEGEVSEEKPKTKVPTLKQILANPIAAYEMLTGFKDPLVDADDCFSIYLKHVKSFPFQKAYFTAKAKSDRDEACDRINKRMSEELSNPLNSEDDMLDIIKNGEKEKDQINERYHALTSQMEQKEHAPKDGQAPSFKLVEAPYAQALKNGWLVEVQESSRIQKQGALVGLNEFSRPGARIIMANGKSFVRQALAMVIFTDNLGYTTCRTPDPSVIRRWDEVFETAELSEDFVCSRVKQNVDFDESRLDLSAMYAIFRNVQEYCMNRQINDGSCSIIEFENWVRLTVLEGYGNDAMKRAFRTAVINKLSEEADERKEVEDAVSVNF